MIILCPYCNIRSSCYDDWMEHLLGRRHQVSVSQNIDKWSKNQNDRSLVGTVSGEYKTTREDVCWHFATYGLICDVYFPPESDFYVIQLDRPEYAIQALDCELKNAGIFSFKLRKDITTEEWVELMRKYKKDDILEKPLERVLSFEQRHLKLVQSTKNIPLEPQLEQFREEVSMKPEELKARMDLISETTNILRKKFPTCELHPYGSFVTGVGSNSSVLHISFEATGDSSLSTELNVDKLSTTETMELFVECIESKNSVDFFCSDLTSDSSNGSTPFVQFVHLDSGVECKFTFENSLSVEASKMIRFIILLDPRFLDLFQLIRYWSRFHKLSAPDRISNYSLTLLLIVFLASKKMIPSVSDLQIGCPNIKNIIGWNAAYCDVSKNISMLSGNNSAIYEVDPVTSKPSSFSILNLAKDFFEQFAGMNFETKLVCPQLGNVCSKSLFESGNEDQLPKCLHTFKQWTLLKTNGSRPNQLNINTPLCIQDVFNLGENVSEKTSETTLKNFQSLCTETVDCIQNVLTCSNPKLMNIFEVDILIESAVIVLPKVYVPKSTTPSDPNVSTVTSTTENTTAPTAMPTSANPFADDPIPPQWISQSHHPALNSPLISKSHDILRFDGRRREIPKSSIPPSFFTNNLNYCAMETNWPIAPCEEFVRLFIRNSLGLTTEATIVASIHTLWCSFLSDFFNTAWTTSFEFYPVPVKPETIMSHPSETFWQSMNKFFDECVYVNTFAITPAFPPHRNPYLPQFRGININCVMEDMAFICYYHERPVMSKDQLAFGFKIIFRKNYHNVWTAYAAARHLPLPIPEAKNRQIREYVKIENSLPLVLKFLVRKYQMFRLHNWFGMRTTNNY